MAPVSEAGVRGACPGVHTPFVGPDGGLVRIRLLGGALTSAQLRACADHAAAGGGGLEITGRANLQLRGVAPAGLPAVAEALVAAGLADPVPARDERRNVLLGPTAGIDPHELLDLRALAAEFAARLAARPGAAPKFGVLLDGGGRVHLRGRPFDLALGAMTTPEGEVLLEVALAGALPLVSNSGGRLHLSDPSNGSASLLVRPEAAGALVDAVLALCPDGGRVRDAVAALGSEGVVDRLVEACPAARSATGCAQAPYRGSSATGCVSVGRTMAADLAGTHDQRQAGAVWCGASPLLGRLDAGTAAALADVADEFGGGEVRLTPWRGVVVPGIPAGRGPAAAAALEQLGLATDPADPVHTVVACAGQPGCAAALTDTQADGARLVALLRALPPAERPAAVHLSGCPKACATREQLAVTLVGGPEPGRYSLFHAATGTDGFGDLVTDGLHPDAALAAVLSAAPTATPAAAPVATPAASSAGASA